MRPLGHQPWGHGVEMQGGREIPPGRCGSGSGQPLTQSVKFSVFFSSPSL